jgi:hypothetical protein
MPDYEFGYQSTKQKLILNLIKLLVLVHIGFGLYYLGWTNDPMEENLRSASSVVGGFWIYFHLLRVKTEIQELFVMPIDFLHAKEFMLASIILGTTSFFFGW